MNLTGVRKMRGLLLTISLLVTVSANALTVNEASELCKDRIKVTYSNHSLHKFYSVENEGSNIFISYSAKRYDGSNYLDNVKCEIHRDGDISFVGRYWHSGRGTPQKFHVVDGKVKRKIY